MHGRVGAFRRSDWAWMALAAGVAAYDLTADEGETLSEACDRYLESRPFLTRVVVTLVATHLLNALHPRLDPLALAFAAVTKALR